MKAKVFEENSPLCFIFCSGNNSLLLEKEVEGTTLYMEIVNNI